MASTVRLSIEELALAISVAGYQQVAHDFMVSSFGTDLNQDEVHGKLTAASHTLLEKQLIAINSDGTIALSPLLEEIAMVMFASQRTIRCSVSSATGQRLLSYHFTGKGAYEHWIDNGVIHVITLIEEDVISTACSLFFNLAAYSATPDASGTISNTLIRQALRLSDTSAAAQVLRDAQLPEWICQQLGTDSAQTTAIGDVLNVQHHSDGASTADQGLMLIFGAERFWLFQPQQRGEEIQLTLLPGTIESLQSGIQQLAQAGL